MILGLKNGGCQIMGSRGFHFAGDDLGEFRSLPYGSNLLNKQVVEKCVETMTGFWGKFGFRGLLRFSGSRAMF